ncbi:MAG: hypothetical protein ACRDTH_11225 [Pseudonocardiaceae bacterium]
MPASVQRPARRAGVVPRLGRSSSPPRDSRACSRAWIENRLGLLLDHVARWLQRTPFLHFGDYDFWRSYQHAVEEVLAQERAVIDGHPNLDDHGRAEQLPTPAHCVD